MWWFGLARWVRFLNAKTPNADGSIRTIGVTIDFKQTGYLKMLITVNRERQTPEGIFGSLSLDWHPFRCKTVENRALAIPAGTYPVEFTWSPRFNMILPLVDNVPNRSDIRIHAANFPAQLEGCIGVGDFEETNAVDNSRVTLNALLKILDQQKDISLQVNESYEAPQTAPS